MPKNWTEPELWVAMNVYCRLPFGQFDQSNAHIKQVAERMGRTPGSLAMKLSNLASLDSYHQQRGVSGLPGASNLDRKVWNDFQEDWSTMAEKSEAAFEAFMQGEAPVDAEPSKYPDAPEGPTEERRLVKVRRVQGFFRKAILGSYENRCALTDLAVPEMLIASHIISWSENESRRADPTNGICLNALHDKAFDRHLITFDEGLRVLVSSVLKSKEAPEFQSYNFGQLEGKPLRLPHRFLPNPEALSAHREIFAKTA
jgi:predicted restriction endonuclease